MPKVGAKNFSYNQKGHNEAVKESQRTGLPIEHEDRNYAQYSGGGVVKGKPTQGYRSARTPRKK